ncbi:MAG: rhodanese-like domain-containing protein [Verrucomicrobia bacterium]|nr:rhodanese-like domain-containing protein [Verrucomicrobiota bacterium]
MNKLFALLLSLGCGTACLAADATFKNISVADADALLKKDKSVVVLDVRTDVEFKQGHIPGATNLDYIDNGFKAGLDKLDKSKTYLLHCQSGGRSAKAEKLMKEAGFKSVLHLKEGFGAWEAQGKPVEK